MTISARLGTPGPAFPPPDGPELEVEPSRYESVADFIARQIGRANSLDFCDSPDDLPWQDFHPQIKWQPQLHLRAASYSLAPHLFPEVQPSSPWVPVKDLPDDQVRFSPSSRFAFVRRVVARGKALSCRLGRRTGQVRWDEDIAIDGLLYPQGSAWEVWMSLTPFEFFTLRPGTRRARGDVVIAGLGMGHQLLEVSRRPQVKRITVVERSQELVDWIWPQLAPQIAKPVEVIVGDAWKVLPDLWADVSLIDIYPCYGHKADVTRRLADSCPHIPVFWGWGDCDTGV